jgi:transcription initiation factor IIE alpha subunit
LKLSHNAEKKCKITNEELGVMLNSKDRTIRENLKLLSEKGYIKIEWQKIATDGKKLPP